MRKKKIPSVVKKTVQVAVAVAVHRKRRKLDINNQEN
jgi:hypothetical protein